MGNVKSLTFILLTFFIFLFIGASPTYAASFFDDFNDGNTDGWQFVSFATPGNNWRIKDGILVQDHPGDGFTALVENHQLSNQIVQTDLKVNYYSGYGGIALWVKDISNWIFVRIYPATEQIVVHEAVNWVGTEYHYPYNTFVDTWYTMKIIANSGAGELDFYLNGNHLFTHKVATPNRIGQTGIFNGNAGGYFDNFSITWPDQIIHPTNKDQCKTDGWKTFTNPSFKNQGACVSFVESNENAGKRSQ